VEGLFLFFPRPTDRHHGADGAYNTGIDTKFFITLFFSDET